MAKVYLIIPNYSLTITANEAGVFASLQTSRFMLYNCKLTEPSIGNPNHSPNRFSPLRHNVLYKDILYNICTILPKPKHLQNDYVSEK